MYGIADISAITNISRYTNTFIYDKCNPEIRELRGENIYARVGCNNCAIFKLNDIDIHIINSDNITDIVFIFDLDSMSGHKDCILTVDEFKDTVKKLRDVILNYGLNLNLHFVPVMYAAETVYLYLLYNCKRNPCEIVSAFNTNKVHGALVAAILGRKKIKDAKCIREQLDKLDVTTLLQKELSKNRYGNAKTLNWLLESDDLLKYTFTEEEMIKYLGDANRFFEEQKVQGLNIIRALGDQFDCNDEDSVKAFIWRHSRKS